MPDHKFLSKKLPLFVFASNWPRGRRNVKKVNKGGQSRCLCVIILNNLDGKAKIKFPTKKWQLYHNCQGGRGFVLDFVVCTIQNYPVFFLLASPLTLLQSVVNQRGLQAWISHLRCWRGRRRCLHSSADTMRCCDWSAEPVIFVSSSLTVHMTSRVCLPSPHDLEHTDQRPDKGINTCILHKNKI